MARVDLKIGGVTKGTFYFGGITEHWMLTLITWKSSENPQTGIGDRMINVETKQTTTHQYDWWVACLLNMNIAAIYPNCILSLYYSLTFN